MKTLRTLHIDLSPRSGLEGNIPQVPIYKAMIQLGSTRFFDNPFITVELSPEASARLVHEVSDAVMEVLKQEGL